MKTAILLSLLVNLSACAMTPETQRAMWQANQAVYQENMRILDENRYIMQPAPYAYAPNHAVYTRRF